MDLRYSALLLIFSTLAPPARAAEAPPSFRVTVTGRGKPMILIPGLACSGNVWDSTVAHYKDRYECHVLTLAGFAGVPRVPAPFLEKVRKDLATYIRAKKLDKPVVVGHSLGGSMTIWLAGTEPSLVGPLVIVDSMPFFGAFVGPGTTVEKLKEMGEAMRSRFTSAPADRFGDVLRQFFQPMIANPADLEKTLAPAATSDPTAVGDAVYELFSADFRPECGRIASPTLVLASWMAYRQRSTQEQVEANFRTSFANLKGAKIVLSPTALHFIMLDDPAWTFREMDAFLADSTKTRR